MYLKLIFIYLFSLNLFSPDPKIDLDSLDIPVNAVATALKDFFSKRLPPLLDEASMAQLEDIASKFHSMFCLQKIYIIHLC